MALLDVVHSVKQHSQTAILICDTIKLVNNILPQSIHAAHF